MGAEQNASVAMTGSDGLACIEYAQCQKYPSAQQALGLELAAHAIEVCILAQRMFRTIAKAYEAITIAAKSVTLMTSNALIHAVTQRVQ